MKKIISVFIAAFVSLLLCSGLFVSCSTKDDDSDTDRAYAEALRINEEYTKLTNIGTNIHGSGLYGSVDSRDSGTEGGIPRHYSDDTKKNAVIYFEASPSDNYNFNINGLVVTTTPESTDIKVALYPEKKNFFSVTVPIDTETVNIDKSNAFVPIQSNNCLFF